MGFGSYRSGTSQGNEASGGGRGNNSGGKAPNQNNTSNNAAAERADKAATMRALAQQQAAQQQAAQAAAVEAQRQQRVAQERAQSNLAISRAQEMQKYSNGVPVDDRSTYGGQQTNMSRADAAITGQNFTPQLPNTAGGWLGMAYNPFSPFKLFGSDNVLYISIANA